MSTATFSSVFNPQTKACFLKHRKQVKEVTLSDQIIINNCPFRIVSIAETGKPRTYAFTLVNETGLEQIMLASSETEVEVVF